MTFSELGLCQPLLSGLTQQGYSEPTPIQAQAIPTVLQGHDVMAAAQTGTGKTAGFTLPILELLKDGERAKPNTARVLILTPTRELAAQVGESVATYGCGLPLNSRSTADADRLFSTEKPCEWRGAVTFGVSSNQSSQGASAWSENNAKSAASPPTARA